MKTGEEAVMLVLPLLSREWKNGSNVSPKVFINKAYHGITTGLSVYNSVYNTSLSLSLALRKHIYL